MTRIINNLNDLTSRHSEVLGNTEGRITYISEEKFYIRTKFYIRMKRGMKVMRRKSHFNNNRIIRWIEKVLEFDFSVEYVKVNLKQTWTH
jgi:hypothetical protein